MHFFLMVRADFFRKRNEDIIRQFPEVGFRDIFIGFESGDPSKLKLYSKGATLGQYQEAIDLLHKYDLFVEGGFIIFSPYATFDSLRQDALFIRRLGVPLFGYHTKELMAFPGTRLFEELVQDGLMVHHSYEKIEFRYRDRRVGDFYHYLQDFFARFEDRDNQLFQVIDFEIKLASSIGRIEDQRIKQEAREFIRQARTTYTKISELNFHFFSAVADVFEQGENAHALRVRRGQFETEHQSLVAPIIRDYHALNMKTGIIQPRLHLLREG